jgi:hypothetical protein
MVAEQEQPLIVADSRIDPDKMILDGVDTSAEPHFTVSEAAKFFFARSPHWMRWREQNFFLMLGGDLTCPHCDVSTEDVSKDQSDGSVKVTKKKVINGWVDEMGICRCGAEPIGDRRTTKGARVYTRGDIELIAHALARRFAITGGQLRNTLSLVEIQARIWGYR